MAGYVFSGAKCMCPFGASGTIIKSRPVSRSGSAMLVISDKPQMNGMCASPANPQVIAANGVPQPCQAQFSGNWVGGSPKVKCCGTSALLSASTINCIYGTAPIKIVPDPSVTVVNTKSADKPSFSDTAAGIPAAVSVSESSFSEPTNQPDNETEVRAASADDNSGIIKDGTSFSDAENKKSAGQNAETADFQEDKPESHQQEESEQKHFTPEKLHDFGLCSGNCPEEYREKCAFREKASVNHPEPKKDGGELGRKMRAANMELFDKCKAAVESVSYKIEGLPEIHYRIERHHLIPGVCYEYYAEGGADDGGNQSEKAKFIMRLGNFYEYDINRPENGIILPTFKSGIAQAGRRLTDSERAEAYYNMMKLNIKYPPMLGAQIHSGHHDYPVMKMDIYEKNLFGSIKDFIAKKSGIDTRMRYTCYADMVNRELACIESYFMNNRRFASTCRMQHIDYDKELFINSMNDLSERIRNNILAFPSFFKGGVSFRNKNYYTSFVAMAYDNGISIEEYVRCINGGALEYE